MIISMNDRQSIIDILNHNLNWDLDNLGGLITDVTDNVFKFIRLGIFAKQDIYKPKVFPNGFKTYINNLK